MTISSSSNVPQDLFTQAADYLRSRLPTELASPQVGIVCGSGLGGFADALESTSKCAFDYASIPGFLTATVAGHAGQLVFGLLGGKQTPAVLMVGRFHMYEGYRADATAFPIRVMKLMGVKTLIVTNAAGGLNPHIPTGTFVLLMDHIALPGLSGNNPLIGVNLTQFGTRFPPMSDAYSIKLRRIAFRAANELAKATVGPHSSNAFGKGSMTEGIYTWVSGPSYETPAEARFLRSLGGDVVGMSTIPEVLVARHCGIEVLGISLVTNQVVINEMKRAEFWEEEPLEEISGNEYKASHEEVLGNVEKRADDMKALVTKIVELL